MEIFTRFAEAYDRLKVDELSLQDYLLGCREDPMMRATAAERMVAAIGEPEMIDTSQDQRLGRIFLNRTIKRYSAFKELYGAEETIERIVGFFRHASQGLEERKQILYLLGPVGGGKSSLAEILKQLMEQEPVYILKAGDQLSPVFESPLGLFDRERFGELLEDKYNIPRRLLTGLMSPWAVKRLEEFGGDISKFSVVKAHPSKLRQLCVAKTEPGDENNQDVSTLVGKLDIRKLEHLSQNDPDAYSYSGGLNRTTQGLLEFVEMFKAPIKVLHPLLTATQEGSYAGTENIGAMPYQGIIVAHSNESEWQQFKTNRNNEAFLDRISVVKVPYCLRATEEACIYEKLMRSSSLSEAPCAPETLPILARFSVLTRLREHENSNLYSKLRVYDGETLKHTDPKARSLQEYRDTAGVDEGMTGISTRFAFKVLSETFNHDTEEVAADPGAPALRARAGDPARAVPRGGREPVPGVRARPSWRRAMPSSSARRSRRPIWNPTRTMARTCSTGTSPMPMPGSRNRTTRIPTPARCSTARSWRPSSPRSSSRRASRTPRTSATRWSSSCCAPGPSTRARTPTGSSTRSCAASSRSACSARSRTCCR